MTFKQATLLAVWGTGIGCGISVLSLFCRAFPPALWTVLGVVRIGAELAVLVFFVTLYRKQVEAPR